MTNQRNRQRAPRPVWVPTPVRAAAFVIATGFSLSIMDLATPIPSIESIASHELDPALPPLPPTLRPPPPPPTPLTADLPYSAHSGRYHNYA